MADDFCIIHGYEHMRTRMGDPIPWCEACDNPAPDLPDFCVMSQEERAAAWVQFNKERKR